MGLAGGFLEAQALGPGAPHTPPPNLLGAVPCFAIKKKPASFWDPSFFVL